MGDEGEPRRRRRRQPPRGPAGPRTAPPCWPAPPSASRRRRSPAPSTTRAPASAAAVRTIVPTLPGSATPCEVDGRAVARRSAAGQRPDGDHARARAERRGARRAGPARPRSPRSRRPAATRTSTGSRPAVEPGVEQVLALGGEQRPRARATCGPELAHPLQPLVVVAGDHLSCRSFRNKKGGPSMDRPGRSSYATATYATASRATSANRRNASGSRTAMSASILRLTSTPASSRPWMSSE